MEINKEFLGKLFEQAVENPRLRQSYDLRTSLDDTSQRMLIALLPGTVVPIHRHPNSNENVLLLCGKFVEVIYDENGNYIGKEDRNIVHRDALWHNTVHCWLYDTKGNIYFQIRKDEQKLYTTESGHVKAGETIKEGFGREIEEEIGIKVDYNKAEFVNIYKFIMDKEKKDGSIFKCICLYF